jgi:WD40 repeat protein
VAVWRVPTRALLWTVPGVTTSPPGGHDYSAAFAPDGTLLALGQPADGVVQLYRAEDGTLVRTLAAAGVRAVAFSPTGSLVAAVGDEGLRLWRAGDGSPFGEIPGQFTAVTFSPDGRTVLVAERDGVLRFFCSVAQTLPL